MKPLEDPTVVPPRGLLPPFLQTHHPQLAAGQAVKTNKLRKAVAIQTLGVHHAQKMTRESVGFPSQVVQLGALLPFLFGLGGFP